MRRSCCVAAAFCTVMSFWGVTALPGASQSLPAEEETDVIVIMRDQIAAVPAGREARSNRASAIASAQAPLFAELQRAQARKVRGFKTINAVATTITKSEAAKLAADPNVKAVVADKVIRLRKPVSDISQIAAATAAPGAASANDASSLCNTLEPEALQLTHTAYLDPATPQAQEVVDGNGQKITGVGVKVAFIADGLDPNVLGFTRPDGTSVFVDYQDFSGDSAATPTAGGEAFGDASSIAAQDHPNGKLLTFDITDFNSPAYPPPKSPCKIQIRGVAPGASLVGLKVFSNLGYTTASSFVQAIEYAVLHDVDVINESFGQGYYPDNDNDPTSLADKAAVAAGVTVIVSSGDSGTNGTLGSPSTDFDVIAVGATTSYRLYAQTGYPGGATTSGHGYVDNNISAFSSGGFAQTGARTVDVVAPGEDGWALCSTNATLYTDCGNFAGTATPIEDFGGTSESAPLTAGEAALIIQAYRSTHHGRSPSPALVKTIIKSTAVDLFAPSSEQGSGLIDALSAVNLALSYRDPFGGAKPTSEGVSFSPNSAAVTAAANEAETATFSLTNQGAKPQLLTPKLQKLGAPLGGSSVSLELNAATDPEFTNDEGGKRAYIKHKFTVPSGTQHLDVAIAYQNPLGSTEGVFLALLNTSGKLSNYSVPQGSGTGYAHVEAVDPEPGSWTAIIWTHVPGDDVSYTGPLQFTWSAQKYVDFGVIHPASIELQPGQSASFSAHFSMPVEPGDTAAAIRFVSGSALQASIPVSLRSLIPIGATGGDFTGVLTGTNGRGSPNPLQTYEFDVPGGVKNMSLTLNTSDNGYLLFGELVDPNGIQVSTVGNLDPFGDPQYGMSLFRYNPQPGRWHFLLLQNYVASGNQTSLPFTARIGFNTAEVSAPQLPISAGVKVSASGKPVVVPIAVVNTGAVTEAYFADARLDTTVHATIAAQSPGTFCVSFMVLPGGCGFITLPTQVTHAEFIAQSNVPITMDAFPFSGYYAVDTEAPDVYARSIGHDTVAATLIEPEVPSGLWIVDPALVGPFGPAGALKAAVSMSAKLSLLPFDPAISSDSGDEWADLLLGTSTFNPLILAPGESGIINVTITPSKKQVGDVVDGAVFIDTYNPVLGTGDEVVRIPYSYSVAK
jgi:Subtilase family/Peptidase inhibitor I9